MKLSPTPGTGALLLLSVLSLLAAHAIHATPSALEANVYCPVTTDEKIDPDISVAYNGREVFFCCKRCRRKFERHPQAYLGNLPPAEMTLGTPLAMSKVIVGHDHAAHDKNESKSLLTHLLQWLGNFHPPSVNFPIALMAAALVAEILFIATGHPLFNAAGRFSVWFAIFSTIPAVVLGWFFAGFKLTDNDWIMTTHRWIGTAAGVWVFVLAWFAHRVWRDPPCRRRGYQIALGIAVALILANGFFGGSLVYGIKHYAW